MVDLYKEPPLRRNKSYPCDINIFNIENDTEIKSNIIEENIDKKLEKHKMFDTESQEYIETDNVSSTFNKPAIRLNTNSVTDNKSEKKNLKFNNTVKVYLIPQRSEIPNKSEIWWSSDDYIIFKSSLYYQVFYDSDQINIEHNLI